MEGQATESSREERERLEMEELQNDKSILEENEEAKCSNEKLTTMEKNKEGSSSRSTKNYVCSRGDEIYDRQGENTEGQQKRDDKAEVKDKTAEVRMVIGQTPPVSDDRDKVDIEGAEEKAEQKGDMHENGEKGKGKMKLNEVKSGLQLGDESGDQDHPVLTMIKEKQPEIDRIIEEVAKRRNLTVLNVKSILRVSENTSWYMATT